LLKLGSPQAGGLIANMIVTMSIPQQKSLLTPLIGIVFFALLINLALALFNLIPIPPLDGHWMLYGLLPYNAGRVLERVSSYGFLVLYGLMFLGMFRFIFVPVIWVLSFLLVL
jgi:Zn-dependent protease